MAAANATLAAACGATPADIPSISLAGVGATAALVLADAAISLLLGLGLHWQLAVGVVR